LDERGTASKDDYLLGHDIFFTREGGEAYLNDLPHAEMHRLAAGHFAVEDSLNQIAEAMHQFNSEKVAR
jgi:hypothetical protein